MIRVIITVLLLFFLIQQPAESEILFQENFDSQNDFTPTPGTNIETASQSCTTIGCINTAPTNWTFYTTTGFWWPPNYSVGLEMNVILKSYKVYYLPS